MKEDQFNKNILLPLLDGKLELSKERVQANRKMLEPWQVLYAEAAIFQQSGDMTRAGQRYAAAIKEGIKSFDLFVNYANFLQRVGRHAESIVPANEALSLRPSDRKAVIAILTAYLDQSRVTDALALIEGLPSNLRDDRQIQLAYCASLRQSGRYVDALDKLKSLSKLYPKDPTVLRMFADTIGEKDSLEALSIYDRALSASGSEGAPGVSAIKWNMSLHLLRARQLERGWNYYRSGLTKEVGTLGRKLPSNIQELPLLTFEEAKRSSNEYVLLIVEQGIGDQIFFFSAFEQAFKEIPKHLLMCEARMKPLLKRSFPDVTLVDPGLLEYISSKTFPISGYLPLGSIMEAYRNNLHDFISARKPYLVVDREKFNHYRSKLKDMAKGRPIVGISWKGGFWENQQKNKTIPIEDWESVFKRDALIVNLQYGNIDNDVDWINSKGFNLVRFPNIDFKQDLDDWLAISAACDGIVSISTALVHFAGAAGQKIALIMPEKQGPFVWGLDEERSIVYPNVYIFRPVKGETVADMVYRVSLVIR